MSPRSLPAVLCLIGVFASACLVRAQYVWSGDSVINGNVSDSGNWDFNGAPPNNGGANVTFGDISSYQNLQYNVLVGAGTFAFNNVTLSSTRPVSPLYTFSGTGGSPVMQLNGNLVVQAGSTVTFNNTLGINIANNTVGNAFDVAASTTLQINGVISGAGHFAKLGTGTVVLTGANTFNYVGGGSFTNSSAIHFGTVHLNGGAINHGATGDITVGDVAGNNGALLISNGGDATTYFGVLGQSIGSTGTATVTGAGSTWTNSNGFDVGYSGTGVLTVADGGIVSVTGGTNTVSLATSGGTGTLNIGAVAGDTAAAGGLINANSISSGSGAATLQFNTTSTAGTPYYLTRDGLWSGTAVLITGDTGIVNTAGYTVIKGANTYTDITKINGGTLADGSANAFSAGSRVELGTGGNLQVNFNETIGGLKDGTGGGTATIVGGATLTINNTSINTFSGVIAGDGKVNTTGTGSLTLSGINTYTGGTNVIAGTLNLTGSITHSDPGSDTLVNGTAGAALNISGGGDLNTDRLRIGITDSTFEGAVTVDGTGSTVTNTTYLYVGEAGFGELSITNGGNVIAPNTSIGNNTGGEGVVLVSGAGSTLTNSSTLHVGSAGLGYLDILSGALATSATGSIGHNVGGNGSVFMDAGGTWNNSGSLLIGNSSTGYLDVYGASTVTALNATLGYLSGSYGEAYLSGTGSTLTTTGNLNIGGSGTGGLYVTNGADVVTGGSGVIANTTGSIGSVTLDGAGSTWTITGSSLYVGNNGSGEAYISNSSLLTVGSGTGTLYLGTNPGSSGQLYFGTYDIEGGDSAGILNAASITTSGGTGKVFFESANATRNAPFYLTKDGTAGGAAVTITGPTQVQNTFGYTVLTGANTYSGGTVVTGGTLVAGASGALGTGTVQLNGGSLHVNPGVTVTNALAFAAGGGTIGGNGTFGSTMTAGTNVHIAPGNSVGTLTFAGGLTLTGGGTLDFEVQSALGTAGVGYDLLSISGGPLNITATSANKFTLKVISLNLAGAAGAVSDFSSANSYAWIFASSATGITGFDANAFDVTTAGSFSNSLGIGAFFVTQSGNDLILNFTPVPEPSTYALVLAGLGLAGFRTWRKRRA